MLFYHTNRKLTIIPYQVFHSNMKLASKVNDRKYFVLITGLNKLL